MTTASPSAAGELRMIALGAIHVDEGFNPRRRFHDSELAALTRSIERRGLLQPVLVRHQGEGFVLVAGERRVRAAVRPG